ncbi:MAG: riboflavin synthase, partial [Candidatus Gastranaerophilaceae bacterium]
MFTGIVEEVGLIKEILSNSLSICCSKILSDIKLGDSIAVNGVCLTVTDFGSTFFKADISKETYNVTNFSKLKPNEYVNLERAMSMNTRFGGHIVTGHIDCVACVNSIQKYEDFCNLEIILPSNLFEKYIVKKGSITVDGVSLTIADCSDGCVKLALIPHTSENTIIKSYKNGTKVNIEFDI